MDDPERATTNPHPKWEVPIELIEWQPSYVQKGAPTYLFFMTQTCLLVHAIVDRVLVLEVQQGVPQVIIQTLFWISSIDTLGPDES